MATTEAIRDRRWLERFRNARGDGGLAVLEGFHPVKHALRFGAELLALVTRDRQALLALAAELAPDVAPALEAAQPLHPELFDRLAPRPPATGVLALARRPPVSPAAIVAAPGPAPVVFLDRPAHLGNLGAVVRVAAAAGAAGVLTTGIHDPWHPDALRGAAGLHFAVPVAAVAELPPSDRPLVALHPGGEVLRATPGAPGALPARAVLAFGSERRGLGREILEAADRRLSLPMRPGVSSLNLATAVAVALYLWRLAAPA